MQIARLSVLKPVLVVDNWHMELAAPTIGEAFDRCVAQGATLVVVHPYFLSPGRHSTADIPRMTAEAAARHPGVRFHVTQPLGLDEKIAALMVQRIGHCLEHGLVCDDCRGREGCAEETPNRQVQRGVNPAADAGCKPPSFRV